MRRHHASRTGALVSPPPYLMDCSGQGICSSVQISPHALLNTSRMNMSLTGGVRVRPPEKSSPSRICLLPALHCRCPAATLLDLLALILHCCHLPDTPPPPHRTHYMHFFHRYEFVLHLFLLEVYATSVALHGTRHLGLCNQTNLQLTVAILTN